MVKVVQIFQNDSRTGPGRSGRKRVSRSSVARASRRISSILDTGDAICAPGAKVPVLYAAFLVAKIRAERWTGAKFIRYFWILVLYTGGAKMGQFGAIWDI